LSGQHRQPLITSLIEQKLYNYIIGKSDSLHCIIHAIGGTENHIHCFYIAKIVYRRLCTKNKR